MLNKLKKLFIKKPKETPRSSNFHFHRCWATVLLPEYQEALFAGLVKMGYSVCLITTPEQTQLANKNNQFSYVIALSLYHPSFPDITSSQIYGDVKYLLDDMKAYYFSIVVGIISDIIWTGCNIVQKKQDYFLPPKSKNENVN